MSSLPGYLVPRDRDAHATIRGFVYQVDLTILRWLDLKGGQALELERGEDIDLVVQALTTEGVAERQRLLEQVKHRERSLTLRDPAALGALACWVEHRITNPALTLRFCFTTNAPVGRERPSPFPDKVACITVWQAICAGNLTDAVRSQRLRVLQRFLTRASKPDGLLVEVWEGFQSFLQKATEEEFLDLVLHFEWSPATTSSKDLAAVIQNRLRDCGRANDIAQAEQQYQRLFIRVFRLLGQSGLKRLTTVDLETQLALPMLSETDQTLLRGLADRQGFLEAQLATVKGTVATLHESVASLARQQGIQPPGHYQVPVPNVSPPPLVVRLARRTATVAGIIGKIRSHRWTALHGGPDTGKSQLVVLASQEAKASCGWIPLNHTMALDHAAVVFDQALQALCENTKAENFRRDWYDQLVAGMQPGSMLVIDDLPRLLGDDPLTQRLLQLVPACGNRGVRVVSTSLYQLPGTIIGHLGRADTCEEPAPSFTTEEAAELLSSFGAPASITRSGLPRFLNGLARGHPLLLTLSAQFLQGRGWQVRDDDLTGLLQGEHAAAVTDEIIGRLVRSLDDPSRDLLYRLTLIVGAFGTDEVDIVARVRPPIERHRERVDVLLGAWLQRDADRRMRASPLVGRLGEHHLPNPIRKATHLALGEWIVQRRMNQFSGRTAIIHFLGAEDHGKVGTILMLFLDEATRLAPSVPGLESLLDLWATTELPGRMDLGMRIMIRALQVAAFPRHGRPLDYVAADAERLLANVTDRDGWAVIALALHAAIGLVATDFDRANRLVRRAFQVKQPVLNLRNEALSFPKDVDLGDVIWFLQSGIKTADHFRGWMQTVEGLPSAERSRTFNKSSNRLCCMAVADCRRTGELQKPEQERKWDDVLSDLGDLTRLARSHSLHVLWAGAIRNTILTLAQHIRDMGRATKVGEKALAEAPSDPDVIFFVAGELGRQLVRTGNYPKALPLLKQALAQPTDVFPYGRMLLLLAASEARGKEDAAAGVAFAQQAVDLAQRHEDIPPLEACRAYCELTLALYLRDDVFAAIGPWCRAAELLFACKTDDAQWKELFVMFAHTSTFFVAMATTGQPPETTRDGRAFVAPARGRFLLTIPGALAFYDRFGDGPVMWFIARLADAGGNDGLAAKWLTRAAEEVDRSGLSKVQTTIQLDMILSLVLADRHGEALDLAFQSCLGLQAIKQDFGKGDDFLGANFDLCAAIALLNAEQRDTAEQWVGIVALVPIVLRIGLQALSDVALARSSIRSLVAMCRQVGEHAHNQVFWSAVCEVLDVAGGDSCHPGELIRRSNECGRQGFASLQVMGYILSAIDATVECALSAHAAVMEGMLAWYPGRSPTYRRLLLPYVDCYWSKAFPQMRFRFRSPQAVENLLTSARAASEERRVQEILRAVYQGLPVQLPAAVQQWLRRDSTTINPG